MKNNHYLIVLLIAILSFLYSVGKCDTPQFQIDSLMLESKYATSDTFRFKLIYSACKIALAHNIVKTLELYRHTLFRLVPKTNYENLLARAYIINYNYFDAVKNSDSSYIYAVEAYRKLNKMKDRSLLDYILNLYAYELEKHDKLLEATEIFLQELEINTTIHNHAVCGSTCNNLGNIANKRGEYPIAIDYFRKAFKEFKYIHDSSRCAIALSNIGVNYLTLSKLDSALSNLNRALCFEKNCTTKQVTAYALANIGNLYHQKKNYVLAIKYANMALEANRTENSLTANSSILFLKGKIAMLQQQYDESSAYFKTCLQNASLDKDYGKMVAIYRELAKLDSMRGQFKGAYFNVLNFIKYYDSTNAYQQKKEIEQASHNADYLLKEAKLKAEQEKADLITAGKIKQSHLIRNITILIACIILIVLLILYNRYIQIQNIRSNLLAERKISEQRSTELKMQSTQLMELNQTKNKLFSIIGHDLRSPMIILDNTLKLINADEISVTKFKAYSQFLQDSVTETINLLDNLLMWSYSQIDGNKLQGVPVNMHQIVTENMLLFKQSAALKQLTLATAVPENLLAFSDQNVVNLVIRNLLSNAIKFSPAGDTISITTEYNATSILLKVMDNGHRGIPAQKIDHLFSHGRSTSITGNQREKGAGLGLVLCADLLKMAGGHISVKSEEGKGSTFIVELPVAA